MTTLKDIDAAIQSFSTDATALNNRAHEINMMILRHCAPKACGEGFIGSNDCTRVPAMVSAMPASWRRTSEIAWWHKNTPIRVKFDGNKVTAFGFADKYLKLKEKFKGEELETERMKWWDTANAIMEPFYLLAEKTSEEGEKKPLTLAQLLQMVSKVAETVAKKGEGEGVSDAVKTAAKKISEQLQFVAAYNFTTEAKANEDTKPEAKADEDGDKPMTAIAEAMQKASLAA